MTMTMKLTTKKIGQVYVVKETFRFAEITVSFAPGVISAVSDYGWPRPG
jgi:hypothetical protein